VLPTNNLRVLHFHKTYYLDTVGGVKQVIFQLARGTESFGLMPEVVYKMHPFWYLSGGIK
jgi:hypothetical protein